MEMELDQGGRGLEQAEVWVEEVVDEVGCPEEEEWAWEVIVSVPVVVLP